jgi:hypothetical protein
MNGEGKLRTELTNRNSLFMNGPVWTGRSKYIGSEEYVVRRKLVSRFF